MKDLAFANEPLIRMACFFGIFIAMATWEVFAPRRRPALSRWRRWPANLGLSLINTALVRVFAPTAIVGTAMASQAWRSGLFNQLPLADALAVPLTVLAMDLTLYLQHLMFHAVPAFWRLHRVHHTDTVLDVSTGVRFHPVEILVSFGIKLVVVVALGAPPMAVVIFEVLLNGTSMFNHGNVRIPLSLDRALRWFIVTPDMHRVHHSVVPLETNSNFGFNLPWWDRLWGTYRAQPGAGHEAMAIGIERFRDPSDSRLIRLLVQPFR